MKANDNSNAAPTVNDTPALLPISPLRIIKINTCTNVTGKSTLTYHIACRDDQSLYFRIFENSGGGYFSFEWVSLQSIQDAFETGPKPSTSFALFTLFEGKSVNTPAFILAAIQNEGLMLRDPDNPRCYVVGDATAFNAEMQALMATEISFEVIEKRKPRVRPVFIPQPVIKKRKPKKQKDQP